MSSIRNALRCIFVAFLFTLPLSAYAANYDVRVLFDTDANRSTGCTVPTANGPVAGVEQILTTSVTVNGGAGTVAGVTRQTCVNGLFFGDPVPVNGGWNVGVSSTGNLFIETHVGANVLTMTNIPTMRLAFTVTSGSLTDAMTTDFGDDILYPVRPGRRHAVSTGALRTIRLDGLDTDWNGLETLASGDAASPALRFLDASAFADLSDLFFSFHIQTNPNAPTALDDFYALGTIGGTLSVSTLGVLNNDSDPNNLPLSAFLVEGPEHGTLSLNANGAFTYTHDGSSIFEDHFRYRVTNGTLQSNLATVTISLPGSHPYTFTSADHVTFTACQPNTFHVIVTGNPTPALTEDGVLPSGVTFTDNGDGTGTLSGTPAPGTVGTYPIVFHAEKNKPHQTDQNFTLTVACGNIPPIITPNPNPVCSNSTGNTAASSPATTYSWSIVNGTITSATNIQTITYTAGPSGTVGLTVTVTDPCNCSSTTSFNVPINPTPVATITPTPPQVCANSTGNSAAGPAGATTYAWSIVNGSITSATNIQTITYTAGASGTVGLTLTVTSASCPSAPNTVNVPINPNPATPPITPTPASVCANSTGNSASGPAGATTYAWSIVNGTITSAANIQTITYTAGASGTVGLTLTVSNASGCTKSNTANVTINPSPATPPITPTPTQVCANSTGNSASGPAGATTYAWSIVNGTITSATNIQTITYTAGASGTVGLTLVVTNASACATSNTVNVTINANPATPTMTPTPAQVCANSTGNSVGGPGGGVTYAWSIANGSITSATNVQIITYTAGASGTVAITLTVTNASGCSATNTVNVPINANPATPTITPTPAQVCANSAGNSAAGPASATTYTWSIVNGTITSATNIQTITYTAGASGTVGLTLTVTNLSGCSASNNANVPINANPATPTITPTPAQVCANSTGNSAAGPAGATTYSWSIANGTITSATNIQTITYTAGASGTVGLTLTVTNPSGCSASNTVNVTINANPATPTITPTPAQVCANSTGNSAAGPAGATTYAWSITGGSITSATNIQTITYTAGASGTVCVTLTVTNASGCSASNTVCVTINPNPATPTITPTPAQVCANSTGNSAAGPAGATTYAWSISNGTITSATNIQTITYTAGASGTVGLTLSVTNASGCPASNNVNVTINPNPATPAITPAPSQVCASSAGNTATGPAGATTYSWSIANGAITSATNGQAITYTAGTSGTVDLTLVVTNASGCSASNTVNVPINANPVTPTITPTPAQVCANSTGNSADGPAGATTYAWSIVNGTITSATNIQTITYTAGASGTVDLTLVVTNASGCSASNTVNVTINANPATPTITPSPAAVCANSTGNTADGPAGATTYAWSIVNGSITSATNIQTITYSAGASGTVDLTLVVTNGSGCSATNTVSVTINPNPATPTITPTPAQVCANSTGNSADGPAGATTYAWSIVNGTITSAANIQTITYTAGASGTVDLTLVVTNAAGCSTSNTVNVTINPTPATPTITPTPAQVCANSTGNSASGPAGATTYAWSIVNGTITSATNIQTITYTAGASGTVGLTLAVTNGPGCPATNTVNVPINANPATPTITPAPAQVCANSTGNSAAGPAGATTYAWSIVNGSITSATNIQTISYTAGASGTVGLTLVVTNASGCSSSNTVNVTINANPATPTITPTPAQVCANSTGNSAAGPAGATTYAWSIVNGTITSATNIQTITYTAGASGTVDLTLVVTNAAGCSASNTVNVTINANPATPTITPTPAQVCANSTGNSAAGPAGATTYAWAIVNGTITSATNIQTITYTAGASGTVGLTLTVTNASGCSASNTVNVTINANPATPTITPSPAAVCANSSGNTADGPAGATTYAWSIVNGSITSATNIQTITYTAGASGTVGLTLVVTNAAGCSASNTVNVTINPTPATPTITPTPAQVCANSTGNSAAGPAGATTYAWSIVNGSITSATNIQTITYTAGASGTVDLTLVVTNAAGCSASNTVNVTINANPATPTITPTPAQVCANSTGNSAAGPAGATTYAWSIVNGSITSATNIQTITYTAGASGTVGLTLTVTNAAGCSASNTVNVTINANPATPTITPAPAQVCANSTGNSAAGPAGATTYAWSIVNGSITSATNIQTITYTAGASGTVGLTLVVTNASGCSASNTVNVTINANPATPTITPTPATLCPSSTGNSAAGPAGATTYSWSITNGTITSATNIQTITYTAGASGNVGLTLVVTNAAGCSASNTVNVAISNVAPVVTSDPNSQSVQAGNSVTFTAGASGTPTPTVQWQVSTGGPFTDMIGETNTSLTFTAQLSQNGNQYRAVFTNACGTATTGVATLTVTCPPITVSRNGGGSFPTGIFNTAYTGQSVVASPSGGGEVYTFAVTVGALPTGLSLSSSGAISGTPTATGVFNFTVTATNTNTAINCTGSQAFSISIAPVATGDSYPAASHLVDNTQFVITGGTTASPATPFVSSATNLITNDLPSGGVAATTGTFGTSAGGSVTIAADGTFIYTPKANPGSAAVTSDSFTYTVVSNGVTSAAATVNLTLANRVWYVKNNGGGTNGQSQSPFTTLAAAQAASVAGDIIFVYNGDGLTTGQSLGITLKNNQQLIGEGVALVVNTVTLKAAGTKPQITNTTATSDVVTIADGDTVKGLTITGTAGARDGISSVSAHAGFTADTITVQNNVNVGVDLISMTGTVTITNSTISTVGNQALTINNGTAAVTVDNTNTINGGTGTAVAVLNRPAAAGAIAIGATLNNGQIQLTTNASGTISFTGSQTLSNATVNGVTMSANTGATVNFSGTLNITTTTGVPFQASGGGTLNVTGTANLTAGAAASGLSLNAITIGGSGVTFNSVNTTGATTGINLVSFAAAGTVTVNGGTITNGTTGISLQGTNTSLSLAGLTITGPTTGITNTTNFGTLTIGASVNVSAVTALNLTTGAISGTFANVSSTGGTNGVNLNAVTGTWGTTAGTLTGATGSTFNTVGTSTGTVTWGGVINQANTANAVTISGSHTGTINFSGNVTTSAASTGISISASSGTYNFTGAASTLAGTGGAVTIFNEGGSISFGTGYAITNASPAFKIGGTATNTTANITYSGTMAPLAAGGTLLDINSAAGTYSTGTITFNGTTLGGTVGNPTGIISVIKNMTGTLVANHLNLTSNNNGFNNTLLAISGTNTGGSFTFNNLTLSATGTGVGKGLTMAAGSGGTLAITNTGGNSTIIVGSTALSLDGTGNAITLNASTLQTLTSQGTGTTSAVLLTNVTGGGTLTLTGGSLTGVAGAGTFVVSSGNPTVTFGGTITQNAANRLVDISSTTSGTISFTDAVTGLTAGAASTGINISSANSNVTFTKLTLGTSGARMTNQAITITNGSTGNTYNLGTISIFTSGAKGIVSTNFDGTLNVTGGTVDSSTATAIDIDGPAGLTTLGISLTSVTSAGGTADGISIQDTNGSFTVNGDGANTSVGGNSTGGTISGKSGADANVTQGIGVYLSNVSNITLRRITINGTNQNYGIRAFAVSNMTLEYSTVGGTNGTTASIDNYGEGSVYFGNASNNGITGTGLFTNNSISGGRTRNMSVVNGGAAATLNLTVKGSTFGAIQNFGDGGDSFGVENRTSGATVNVIFGGTLAGEPNTLTNAVANVTTFATQAGSIMDVQFKNNTLSNNNANNIIGGSSIILQSSGSLTYVVSGNTMRDANGSAIALGKQSAGTLLSGQVINNTVGVSGTLDSGSKTGNGIFVSASGGGTVATTIKGNQIHQIHGNCHIYADNTGGSYAANFTIEGNTLDTWQGTNFAGIAITNGAPSSTDTVNVCAKIGGTTAAEKNTLNLTGNLGVIVGASGAAAGHTFNLPTYAGGANLTNVQNFIQGNNSGSFTTSAYTDAPVTASAFTGTGTGCPTP